MGHMRETTRVFDATVDWLLAGDPAIKWQAERDLVGAPESVWAATRSQVSDAGWGRRLLGAQDADDRWGGGLYTPKWTSTNYTLLLLRRFGLDPGDDAARAGCRRLLEDARWIDGGISYWPSHDAPERCVNAMVLSVCSYFRYDDPRIDSIADGLIGARMSDGGWNCADHRGAVHSSFHTTISALEALSIWAGFRRTDRAVGAIDSGIEFMLLHGMYRSHRTGEPISEAWLTPHFPPRWHYDTLRGLDFLATVGIRPEGRVEDAIERLLDRRRADGRWPKGSQYSGRTFFALEPGREGGRWNTLRSLRVMDWWEGATA